MNHTHRTAFVPLLLSVALLQACDRDNDAVNTDYSQLKLSRVSAEPLTRTSRSDFERYLKNGIRARLLQSQYPVYATDDTAMEASGNADADTGSSSAGGFTTTNVHEQGVDEADRMKYDGQYLYIVTNPYGGYGIPEPAVDVDAAETTESRDSMPAPYSSENGIRILRTDSTLASAEEVHVIESESSGMMFSELYLRVDADQLIALSNGGYYAWDASLEDSDWHWNNGKVELKSYDVSDPENPGRQSKLELEGSLHASRRIGDKLYIVTRYIPNIQYIDYGASTEKERQENERLINETPLSDLLPHYQSNDGAIKSLVSAEDCLVSEDLESNHGYADLVTLTAVDLDDLSVAASVCLNTNVNGIYSSTSGFYIGGTSIASWYDYSNLTTVHKFNLDDGNIDYRATAAIPGYLGWDDPSFRMDEVDNDLRIVTTDFVDSGNPVHQLTILREEGDSRKLKVVSRLPDTARPEPIGKPGEDIYAVRFMDDRAYIVTFERIDPLYVINLANHESPEIAGELEIPGFSRYLHPVEEGWLLGIGQEVTGGQPLGIKIELYDVRDMNSPSVKNKIVLGGRGSYSEVFMT